MMIIDELKIIIKIWEMEKKGAKTAFKKAGATPARRRGP